MAYNEKYCSVAGGGTHAGTSEVNAWTLAEAIAGYAAGDRINVIAGTYANTTTSRTFATAGAAATPIWWRGYAVTIGDLDDVADGAASGPQITFTTGLMTISAADQRFSSMSISGAQVTAASGQVVVTQSRIWLDRCRIDCTAANANSVALRVSGGSCAFTRSYLKSTSSAHIVNLTGAVNTTVAGCTLEGGLNSIVLTGLASQTVIYRCIFNNVGGNAVLNSSNALSIWVLGCTFYSAGDDSIDIAVTTSVVHVMDSVFSESAVYAINMSGGVTRTVRMNNLYHASGTADEANTGDWTACNALTDAGTPFAAAGTNFFLVVGSNARQTGFPGKFENLATTTKMDVGAVGYEGGAGGTVVVPVAQAAVFWVRGGLTAY